MKDRRLLGEEKKEECASPTPPRPTSDKDDRICEPPAPPAAVPTSASPPPAVASSLPRGGVAVAVQVSFRLVLLAASVSLLLAFGMYVATHVAQRVATDYLVPLVDAQVFTPERRGRELTYYHRLCTKDDVSTRSADDLVIDYDTMTTDDAVLHQMRHGASLYPNLLSESTANAVRDFILQQNLKNEDMIEVIENKNRWSFGMRVDQHPSVTKALKEVLSNSFLVGAMEKIMGPDPAVIEFTGITSAYGAKVQRYHADVVPEGNGAKWGRTFVPSYSLFIPLQNITAAMGATEVCPGSHMCGDGCFDFCPTEGFQVSGPRDNWPQGWGALVNQQTFHRGAAHVDRHGPHRVLFILTFAPRPQYGRRVETRMIGQGGSYSLHWSQWGHTLRDFRDSARRMAQPWRLFRSFGLYKIRNAHWGYDYLTQASARIANNELGFYHSDLEEYVNKKGGFELLPSWLHADVPPYGDSSYEIWVPYYLDTLRNCQSFLRSAYWGVAATVIVCLVIARFQPRPRRATSTLAFPIACSIAYGHLLILGLAWLYLRSVADSPWGINILRGRAYQWPSLPHPIAPALPATLPTVDDVMVFDDLQSDYLGMFTDIMDVFHPGNAAWLELAVPRSVGYHRLPAPLQSDLCCSLLRWTRQQGRRVLMKNADSDWAEAPAALSQRWCHKEMAKLSHPDVSIALRHLDYLLTEAKFGYWRETAMVRRDWIPQRLLRLQDEILRYRPPGSQAQHATGASKQGVRAFLSPKTNAHASKRAAPTVSNHSHRVLRGASVVLSQEPEVNKTWIKVGSNVEAAYGSLMTEWYRATVSGVNADLMTWDVVYEDGEEELGLCQQCVRPFVPYRMDEEVGWRNADGNYDQGRIVAVHSREDSYDVHVGGRIRKQVRSNVLRRLESFPDLASSSGRRVLAYVLDEDDWYPGVVRQVNPDGTMAVEFDDGDYLDSVEPQYVVPEGAQ